MNINLHIERLVLDPAAVAARDTGLFSAALRNELSRLLAARAIPITQGAALHSLRAAPVSIEPGAGAHVIGRGVAQSIHGSLDLP
jgi:hypothetical protein